MWRRHRKGPQSNSSLPWQKNPPEAVGTFARNHGARVPGRQVSSAKSWLSHPGVDRTAPLLPWAGPPDVPRLSPLEVSARYLRHFVEAWDQGGMVTGWSPTTWSSESAIVNGHTYSFRFQTTLIDDETASILLWPNHPSRAPFAGRGGEFMLVVYDLNGFKGYNDAFGHPAGDALLQRLATRLSTAVCRMKKPLGPTTAPAPGVAYGRAWMAPMPFVLAITWSYQKM